MKFHSSQRCEFVFDVTGCIQTQAKDSWWEKCFDNKNTSLSCMSCMSKEVFSVFLSSTTFDLPDTPSVVWPWIFTALWSWRFYWELLSKIPINVKGNFYQRAWREKRFHHSIQPAMNEPGCKPGVLSIGRINPGQTGRESFTMQIQWTVQTKSCWKPLFQLSFWPFSVRTLQIPDHNRTRHLSFCIAPFKTISGTLVHMSQLQSQCEGTDSPCPAGAAAPSYKPNLQRLSPVLLANEQLCYHWLAIRGSHSHLRAISTRNIII